MWRRSSTTSSAAARENFPGIANLSFEYVLTRLVFCCARVYADQIDLYRLFGVNRKKTAMWRAEMITYIRADHVIGVVLCVRIIKYQKILVLV